AFSSTKIVMKSQSPMDSIIVVPALFAPMKATPRPSSGTLPYEPLSMKRTKPPLHCECVGLEPNQHGQAALQEQASSSWPDIFQGVFLSSAVAANAVVRSRRERRSRERM